MSAPWSVLGLPPVPHALMVDVFDPRRRDDVQLVTPTERTQDEVARGLLDEGARLPSRIVRRRG